MIEIVLQGGFYHPLQAGLANHQQAEFCHHAEIKTAERLDYNQEALERYRLFNKLYNQCMIPVLTDTFAGLLSSIIEVAGITEVIGVFSKRKK